MVGDESLSPSGIPHVPDYFVKPEAKFSTIHVTVKRFLLPRTDLGGSVWGRRREVLGAGASVRW